MRSRNKLFWIIILLFIASDLLIFIARNKGFEYKKFSTKQELYPQDQDSSFLNKWTGYNKRFTPEDLDQGLVLLKQSIGIDTISSDENKAIQIAGWLYNSFRNQLGTPDSYLNGKPPLPQYQYLSSHKEKYLWCGNFQAMVGFFCTAAMLPNRYVEIAPLTNSSDTHEVNEVYIARTNKWVLVDATRNFLQVRKDDRPFSTAEYFDYESQKVGDGLFYIQADTLSGIYSSSQKNETDKYFNENHFLRYYYTLDLSEAYSFWPKIKRYFLADPWYEIYSPDESHSNWQFRIKQFFLFGSIAMLAILIFLYSNAGSRKARD